jgi:voltage-gated potassium channel Kch
VTGQRQALPQRSNAYNIFILVLTVMSLAIMVLLLLPLAPAELQLLAIYDNLVCVVFLIDFALNLRRAPSKQAYFFRHGGWLDLVGSIPSFGLFRFGPLLRIARLGRLARITKLLRGDGKKRLLADVLANRGQYAAFITMLSAFIVLVVASLLVLQFEAYDEAANIRNGGDALWWAMVTITTVGYGDKFPVTSLGRLTGVSVMFAGVGIIGALASILASMLVPQPKEEPAAAVTGTGEAPATDHPTTATAMTASLEQELAAIRAELAALRATLAEDRRAPTG